jgi:hypothetical protein
MKSKYRNRLDVAADMRIQLFSIVPNIKKSVMKKAEISVSLIPDSAVLSSTCILLDHTHSLENFVHKCNLATLLLFIN